MLTLHANSNPVALQATPSRPDRLRLASPAGTPSGAEAAALPDRLLASGFHELVAAGPGDETSAQALALSLAARGPDGTAQSLCYCALAGEAQEHGRLYGPGLTAFGIDPARLVIVTARKEQHLLWALEEAIVSKAFGAVIGTLGRMERLYSFPASRRLKLRAAASGARLLLLRSGANGGATAANGRWRVSALPSRSEGTHAGYRLLGAARIELELDRMAGFQPQRWEMEFDAARGFHLAPLLANGPAGETGEGRRQSA